MVFPISADTLINVVAFTSKLENQGKPIPEPEIRDVTKDEVLASFSRWEEEVIQLLSVSSSMFPRIKSSEWVSRVSKTLLAGQFEICTLWIHTSLVV